MDLRRFLFENRITQKRLVNAIIGSNSRFDLARMSRIVNGWHKPTDPDKAKIVKGLLKLGYPRTVVEALEWPGAGNAQG